jgi:hypothetical protein
MIVLHARENRGSLRRSPLGGLSRRMALILAALAASFFCAVLVRGRDALSGIAGSPAPPTLAAMVNDVRASLSVTAPYGGPVPTAHPRIEVGVTTLALTNNAVLAWQRADLTQVEEFELGAAAHTGIVMWYVDWAHSNIRLSQLREVAAMGSTPEITWEPWDATGRARVPQPRYSLQSIVAGRHDAYIRSVALLLKKFGKPVWLRFAQEMNGSSYPWGRSATGGFPTPQTHIAAWRHIHDIFSAVGATNVRWVWSPLVGSDPSNEYPGSSYVDIVGLSGFNGGSRLPWGGWRSFASIFNTSIERLHRIAPDKPMQISETSSSEFGGRKAEWIRGMFGQLERRPYITSLVWFDAPKQSDWPIESSSAAMAAFKASLAAYRPS